MANALDDALADSYMKRDVSEEGVGAVLQQTAFSVGWQVPGLRDDLRARVRSGAKAKASKRVATASASIAAAVESAGDAIENAEERAAAQPETLSDYVFGVQGKPEDAPAPSYSDAAYAAVFGAAAAPRPRPRRRRTRTPPTPRSSAAEAPEAPPAEAAAPRRRLAVLVATVFGAAPEPPAPPPAPPPAGPERDEDGASGVEATALPSPSNARRFVGFNGASSSPRKTSRQRKAAAATFGAAPRARARARWARDGSDDRGRRVERAAGAPSCVSRSRPARPPGREGATGAWLQEDWALCRAMVAAAAAAVPETFAVTVKLRVQYDAAGARRRRATVASRNALVAAGARLVALHARTRGRVDARRARATASGADLAVVLSNGNVRSSADVAANLAATGAAGVMVAEQLLRDPSLFAPAPRRPEALLGEYLDLLLDLERRAAGPRDDGSTRGKDGAVTRAASRGAPRYSNWWANVDVVKTRARSASSRATGPTRDAQRNTFPQATGACLWGLGDVVAQSATRKGDDAVGAPRLARAVTFGCVVHAPIAHVHYEFLESFVQRLKVPSGRVPLVKLVMEQFAYWGYFSNAFYHFAMATMEGERRAPRATASATGSGRPWSRSGPSGSPSSTSTSASRPCGTSQGSKG
ncbi:tRNA-dihydrouridine synthase [Aureococcus anophagefferens]|uniref:tRNA-dihydrouridine synthase n=1 Tax=Aureococcus anophagefferens TaxID=44056 RepID=A0ABR1G751_AURAN